MQKCKVSLPLDKMSIEEKIQTMETLWDDLCKKENNLSSPTWHKQILQEREKQIKKGSDAFEDWEKAKKHIRDSIS